MLAQYEKHCMAQKGFFCSTITCVDIPQQLQRKRSGRWNWNFSHTSHIVHT